jgi:hypothetical protein
VPLFTGSNFPVVSQAAVTDRGGRPQACAKHRTDEWCRPGAQWCVPTNQSVRSWPATSLVPRIRFCSAHHAADVDVADPRGTGSAHRMRPRRSRSRRSLPEPLRPRPISEQTVSSSQASSLDTVHPWSHVPASGLVSRGPVRPRMRCLQLVVRGSDRPDNGLSEPFDRLCAIDRLRRGQAAVACGHDHKCAAATTQ